MKEKKSYFDDAIAHLIVRSREINTLISHSISLNNSKINLILLEN